MRRQRARWRWLLWESRGYQARGTFSVRPSSRTTLSSSSVTLTSTARTLWRSLAKEAIPTPQQFLPIALHQLLDLPNLRRPEASARLKTDRAQPELRRPVIALDMNVRRLAPVAGIEEEAIGSRPQDCRHGFTLTECSGRDETFTTRPNASHHLPAEAGKARCSRSGACGCYAAFSLPQPLVVHFRPTAVMHRCLSRFVSGWAPMNLRFRVAPWVQPLPSSRSTTQQPRACSRPDRQCSMRSAFVQPAASRASARRGMRSKARSA